MFPNSFTWLTGLRSLLAPGQRWVPCHVDLSIEQLTTVLACIIASERSRTGERGCPRYKLQSFYNLIWEGTSHCFCHILFLRSKSISPAYTQWEGITQEHESQEAGITGGHLGGCWPHGKNISATFKSVWRLNVMISVTNFKTHPHQEKEVEANMTKC